MSNSIHSTVVDVRKRTMLGVCTSSNYFSKCCKLFSNSFIFWFWKGIRKRFVWRAKKTNIIRGNRWVWRSRSRSFQVDVYVSHTCKHIFGFVTCRISFAKRNRVNEWLVIYLSMEFISDVEICQRMLFHAVFMSPCGVFYSLCLWFSTPAKCYYQLKTSRCWSFTHI